jgi:hypothetical protein
MPNVVLNRRQVLILVSNPGTNTKKFSLTIPNRAVAKKSIFALFANGI